MEETGKYIWISDDEYEWIPGKIIGIEEDKYKIEIKINNRIEIRYENKNEEFLEIHPSCIKGVEDLLLLGDFNKQTLLHNTRERFSQDEIYSFIGTPILIAVNPYKKLTIYEEKQIKHYKDYFLKMRVNLNSEERPKPHLYHMAEAAYQEMLAEKTNQCIIISGESGSGKTESTKIILKYLAVSSMHNENNSDLISVEKQVLDSNPILEAFGNAKTLRNNNSSRFGKFIQVNFTEHGKIISAKIFNYLLEKSRIVTLNKEERNYHIFYQILKGADELEKKKYFIKEPEYFFYLSQSECYNIEDEDDKNNFLITKECLSKLNFKNQEIHLIFTILMGILYLGNTEFTDILKDGQICADLDINKSSDFKIASEMLGIDPQILKNILIKKKMKDLSNNNFLQINLSVDSAYDMRDGLAKLLYSKMFNWLVRRINEAISNKDISNGKKESKINSNNKVKTNYIGLLDIFGFENFNSNSFEQLCINYANERLQQYFNNHIFKMEQEEYKKEKIDWSNIEFIDNLEILNLIDNPKMGIFSLLDSEGLLKNFDDNQFRNKIYNYLGSKDEVLGKTDEGFFLIHHYAGDVFYDVNGFIIKNNDNISKDLNEAMENSKNKLISKLFSNKEINNLGSKIQTDSLSKQFKKQLDELLKMLSQSNPRYVKCIKPNSNKSPQILDSFGVGEQLLSAGVLEAIKIRKQGFSIRRFILEFVERYINLTPMLKNKFKKLNEDFKSKKLLNDTTDNKINFYNDILQNNLQDYSDLDYKNNLKILCEEMLLILSDSKDLKPFLLSSPPLIQIGITKVFMKEEVKNILEFKLNRIKYIYRIQSTYRMFVIKRKFNKLKYSICVINKFYIGFLNRKQFKKIRKVIKIQRFYLHFKNKRIILNKLKRLVIEAKKMKNRQSVILNSNSSQDLNNNKNNQISDFLSNNKINFMSQNSTINEKENTTRTSHKIISDDNTSTIEEVMTNLNMIEDFNLKIKKKKRQTTFKDFSIRNLNSIVDSELTTTLQSLNEEIKSLKLENEICNNNLSKFKDQSENKEKQIEVLETKLIHMKEVVLQCEDEIREMNNKIKNNLDSTISYNNEEILQKLKDENLLLKRNLNEKETEIEITNMKFNEISNNNMNLIDLNNNLKDQITKRKEKEEKELNKLLEQINEITKEKYQMEKKYKDIIEFGNSNTSFLTNIDPGSSSLSLISTGVKNISDYKKQISILKNENKNLNLKLEELKSSHLLELEKLKSEIINKDLELNKFILDYERIENDSNLIKKENFELSEMNKKFKEISQDLQIKNSILEKNSNNISIKNELESTLNILKIKENKIIELVNINEDNQLIINRNKQMENALRNELKSKENEIIKRNEIIKEIQEEIEKTNDDNISYKKEIFNLKTKLEVKENEMLQNYENSIKNKNQEIFILKEKENKYEKFIMEMKEIMKKKQNLLDNKKKINLLLVDLIKIKRGEVQCLEALKFTSSSNLKENLSKIRENEKLILLKIDEISNNNEYSDDSEMDEEDECEDLESDEFNSSKEEDF